jgi:hypothetical protein
MSDRIAGQWTRRQMLARAGTGFGMLGLAGMLHSSGLLPGASLRAGTSDAVGAGHFVGRAKRVIFLFMNGAPSHVDTFDPKPALEKHSGEKPDFKLYKDTGTGYMPSPFRFQAHGESGVVMSELFPQLAGHADDLCVLRSMYTDVPNHEPGLLLMHSGNQQPIRPSLGSWITYGLGTENQNLPSFVVLCPGRPVVGPYLWANSFLPGEYQGTAVDTNEQDVARLIGNLNHPTLGRREQRRQLDLLQSLNRLHQQQRGQDDALESQIRAFELAFNMQREASDAFSLGEEPQYVLDRYGDTAYGRSCLLARRLAERGVRYIQVYYVSSKDKQPWDTHQNNDERHRTLCADSDRGTAALLADLKERGLLEDTLVIWGGEFGRTPYAQVDDKKKAKPGRDHHHTGFSMFLAGGGVRGGVMHGQTDEFGMHAVQDRVHVHDLHATILHLLGIDHTRLTYHYSGRDFRLTDVHGRVVTEILA